MVSVLPPQAYQEDSSACIQKQDGIFFFDERLPANIPSEDDVISENAIHNAIFNLICYFDSLSFFF